MNWATIILSMTASAFLTMALTATFIWWRQRKAWDYLLFALAALAAAAIVGCDVAEMQAVSAAQYALCLRWAQVAVWVMILSLAGFLRLYLRAGRAWLLWTVVALRTISLALNFLTGTNLNYKEITGLQHITFLGQSVAIAQGAPNPWMLVGQLSLLALLIFVVDAAVSVWRRGEQRRAAIVGGSVVLFLVAGGAQVASAVWGNVQWPLTPGLFYLGVVAAMGYEIGGEALRAVRLARDLRTRDEQMTLAAEAADLGFWVHEYSKEEFWGSDHWRALLGYTKSEPLYMSNFIARIHSDDRDVTLRTIEGAERGDGRYQMEHRVVLPDGQVRWLSCQGRVGLDRDGQPTRMQGVSIDITRRKQAELEAQTHRNDVAHLLRVASLGELSSALAHELKQPLSAILSNAQTAELSLARGIVDLATIREILQDIVKDDERASEVIDRLHSLLKKNEFQSRQLEANQLIEEVLKLMNHHLTACAVHVVTELGNNLPPIRGDRVQLQQVLINLILNAGDAMSQCVGKPRKLTVRSSPVASDVLICVEDTGDGIPSGREEVIFEPYHTTKPQGLGLGLSLSRAIVAAHGGRMWAQNQASGGAAFHLTVPGWAEH
jgi:two-component system, LuxR family, sensor kinase FixL